MPRCTVKDEWIYAACTLRPQVMAPHLTAFAARVDELWAARRIWPGERCVLSDAAMLAAAKAGDPNLQGQVSFYCT